MDVILECLNEAQSYIDMMEDLPLYETFFKEGDEDKNEVASEGAIASIKKAFEHLIQFVKDIIHSIKDFFASKFLSKEEKEQYKNFKRMIKTDPRFKGQKVFMEDWKEYQKIFDEAQKELEEAAKKKDFNQEMVDNIKNKAIEKIKVLQEKFGDVAKRAAYSVAIDTAVDMADACQLAAMGMEGVLNSELGTLEKIENELGANKAKKFKKDIEAAAKNGILHRAYVWLFKRKTDTLNAICKKQTRRLLSFTNIGKKGKPVVDPKSLVTGAAKNPDLFVDAMGGVENAANTAKNLTKTAIAAEQFKGKVKKAKKEAGKQKDQLNHFLGFDKKKDK